ncbi:MAG: hydroxymethylglutaryl-CoA reductase, partial [Gammaproteobacteria bacterium]|nr:hydroxymethylglutaryl-CoA reductase [Gammaproteobacteria bacterium]NIR58163.1 hydroxymethylglutaryl-CoA reductase [Gammaproteobacteria bacterium]NIR88158.1 hydroxymethylglutaryl-CoA reductase [Gammaproteobacteria bacterium]
MTMSSTTLPAAASPENTFTHAGEPERAPRQAQASPGADATRSPLDLARERWDRLHASEEARRLVLDEQAVAHAESYEHNVENYIGTVKVPVGLAGPLRLEGRFAVGDFYLPLATTEAALVASYNRGARLITEAGGCTAMVLDEGLARSPGFAFGSLAEAAAFADWIHTEYATLQRVAASTTRHGRLIDVHTLIEGNHVYLDLEFTTGDAAGQNMATFAADALLGHIERRSPVKPRYGFLEANHSGDKKASARAFLGVRGKRVSAEIVVPAALVEQRLHTSVERMIDYWRMAALGGVLSGTIGVQGHYANGLAALYIACGQDAACVAESAVGVTRFEPAEAGALYVSVTLSAVVAGTVGGGTKLPSQQACLRILDLPKAG